LHAGRGDVHALMAQELGGAEDAEVFEHGGERGVAVVNEAREHAVSVHPGAVAVRFDDGQQQSLVNVHCFGDDREGAAEADAVLD
jgi:hypothetical protein